MGERNTDGTTQSMAPEAGLGGAMPSSTTPGKAAVRVGPPTIDSAPIRDPQRYAVLGEHGRGALGRVSRAHDKELGRDVAIKELIVRDPRGEARFMREALITARLEHPGIVAVHEAGRWPDGTPFYAMKLVSGRPLRELMLERTTVDERIGLLHHVIAVADAIAYAHGRNIIHRDLKPSNVIVGDFGETVVVDWGLAKDLSAVDPSARGRQIRASGRFDVAADKAAADHYDTENGPPPDPHGTVADGAAAKRAAAGRAAAQGPAEEPVVSSAELTQVGTVLGTPAYMAPEQLRGDPVDRRADVFAIGIMLWELCAPSRIPPSQTLARRQVLRRAGIDDDLISILDKALDPDPEHRYADAGALANDLKAFKAGARVAARSYSLLALLSHWMRRHRAFTLSVVAVTAAALVAGVAYIRNIAVERDRADASESDAKRAREASDTALDQLTLNHAQLWLDSDPSAALDALAKYHGPDQERAEQIRAEAVGHGVAILRAAPHTNRVSWAEGTADGSIVSLSTDGTIARTARDGVTAVVARDVSKRGAFSYARSRNLLAYTCDSNGLCLVDVDHALVISTEGVLRGTPIANLSFSPDETHLAVLSQDAVLRVFDLTNPSQPSLRFAKPVPGNQYVKFVDDGLVAVNGVAGAVLLGLEGSSEAFSLPGIVRWDASAANRRLVLATSAGEAVVLSGLPLRVESRNQICQGLLFDVRFIPNRTSVAYACRAGAIGVWDLQHNTVETLGHLEGVAGNIVPSPDGEYVIATSGNGTVTVFDLATDLIASYKGHGHRVTAIAAPTSEHPFVISGDAGGSIRSWSLPVRIVRVVARSSMPFGTAIFDRQSSAVIATSLSPGLTIYSPTDGARTIQPHDALRSILERSSAGKIFAAYGLQDAIEVWSSDPPNRMRVIHTGHGSISQLRFVDGTDDFITSGHDGKLILWTPSGEHSLVAKLGKAIDSFVHVTRSMPPVMVVSTTDGALWRTDERGNALQLRGEGSRVTQLVVSADRRLVYAGYADGQVVEINTASWRQETILHGHRTVQAIDLTNDGGTLAVATSKAIHVRVRARSTAGRDAWTALEARARHVSVATDGLVIAASASGVIWLYSSVAQRWQCLIIEGADVSLSVVAPDGKAAVALDRGGRLLWIDLESARQMFDVATSVKAIMPNKRG